MKELYDFSDWEPAEPPNMADWVLQNLRDAFKQFGDGYWMLWTDSAPALEWTVRDWDADPVRIRIGPDDLRGRLIDEVDAQVPNGGRPLSEEERKGVRDVLGVIGAWRAALAAAEAHANEVLSRPIAGTKQ